MRGLRFVGYPTVFCLFLQLAASGRIRQLKWGVLYVLKRIIIADDHESVLRGLRQMLSQSLEWEICGDARNGQDAVTCERTLEN
jgi:hypothetical protein